MANQQLPAVAWGAPQLAPALAQPGFAQVPGNQNIHAPQGALPGLGWNGVGFAQVPVNQNIHAPQAAPMPPPPPPPMPPIYSFKTAFEELSKEPKIYKVWIDGKKATLLTLFRRLQGPDYPQESITVRHPDHMRVSFYKMHDTQDGAMWSMDVSSPVADYGVLSRTYGTQHFDFTNEDLFDMWQLMKRWLPDIDNYIYQRQVIESKEKKLLANAMGKLANVGGLPENMVPYMETFVTRPRVRGWATGASELRKINTSLFKNKNANTNRHLRKISTNLFTKNGGKRKGPKTRKQRKH